ncbi:hypothetical protein RHMOL_Rhmol03G0253900 [Rhododendron molle]|uniref:Uncharacterized protein n=1 Tax=Rhododendron molle TaxID=49168 RepID=A0ACC0PLI3_RHOML|nr:hypothetical protein RHMOL_Rhmol03G0253900 [Rhododendron molle]
MQKHFHPHPNPNSSQNPLKLALISILQVFEVGFGRAAASGEESVLRGGAKRTPTTEYGGNRLFLRQTDSNQSTSRSNAGRCGFRTRKVSSAIERLSIAMICPEHSNLGRRRRTMLRCHYHSTLPLPKSTRLEPMAIHLLSDVLCYVATVRLISDVFKSKLSLLLGLFTISHVRYSTTGASMVKNV